MPHVPDWQTDTNTIQITAFNYLELKLFRCWWHILPSHAGCIGRMQQHFAFNTNSLRCVFMSPAFAVHYLLTYLVLCGLGGFVLCTHSDETCLLWFFLSLFFVSPKWWNCWVNRLVGWWLETSAETTKNSFKNTHAQKKTSSSRRFLHTFHVHVLIWFVCPCQISFFWHQTH